VLTAVPFFSTAQRYGLFAIVLHWTVAGAALALFALGWWMTGLDYYHPWYHRAPALHQSFGVLFTALVVLRLTLRLTAPPVEIILLPRWQRLASRLVHQALDGLLILVVLSGYLLTTAKGQGIDVFGWFTVPAIHIVLDRQEDLAGFWHETTAWTMIVTAGLHAAAALDHHFRRRDDVLRAMLGIRSVTGEHRTP